MAAHSQALSIHKGAYIQNTDPASSNPTEMVAKVLWIDTNTLPYTLKRRNDSNNGWDVVNIGATATMSVANASVTGTTVKRLAKLTGAPSRAVVATTTDRVGMIGIVIAGAGTTGNAIIAVSGVVTADFDGPTVTGHYVVASTTSNGKLHDAGAAWPVTEQVLGIVLSTNGVQGLFDMILFPPEVRSSPTYKKTLTDAVNADLFDIALPTLKGASGVIEAQIFCADATDVQVYSAIVRYAALNKGGVYTLEGGGTLTPISSSTIASAGTLTVTWSIVSGTNKVTLRVNADTSLTPTTFHILFRVMDNSEQVAMIL